MHLEPLLKPAVACFHGIEADPEAALATLSPVGRGENSVVRHLRGTHMDSVRRLFDEWAAALQFPPTFDENWEAFDECLNDLDWLPEGPCVLLILDAECLLDRAADDDLEILARILSDTVKAWNEARAFHVILQWAPEAS